MGGVLIVGSGRCVGDPFSEHNVPGPGVQGMVGACHELGGRMLSPAGRGAWRPSGKRVRPSWRGRVRWNSASTGKCFLIRGNGTGVRQSSER